MQQTTTKEGTLASVRELHRYTKQGTAERIMAAAQGAGKYLSLVTAFERRVIEALVAEGRLEARIGHRQAWVQATNY
jgi:hypothetical protein